MFRIALCDDCPRQTEELKALLEKYQSARPGMELQACGFLTGEALLEAVQDGQRFDLYILDILMPELNGIQLAQALRTVDGEVLLLFLTASTDYALDAFNVSAAQYLLKPVGEETLFPVLDKIVAGWEREPEPFFLFAMPDRTVRVSHSSIILAELKGRALRLCLADGGALFSKTIRVPFASAMAVLLRDSRFLHAHKSFILNMDHVRELTPRSFIMADGNEVPIPRNKYTDAKNTYFNYLSAKGIGLLGGVSREH